MRFAMMMLAGLAAICVAACSDGSMAPRGTPGSLSAHVNGDVRFYMVGTSTQ